MSEWLSEYQEGSFVDCKDTMNTWCISKILSINKEAKWIRVRYDGWSEKWDSSFSFHSNRICPFRRRSELYTGQKGIAIRNWTFSAKELADAAEKLKNLPSTPFEVTQFLRGQIFTLIDCLLVFDYKQVSDLEAVIQFFMVFLDFLVMWIKNSAQLFPFYYEGVINPDLFLTNYDVAKASAWPELIFTLKRLFGLDPRTSKQIVSWTVLPSDYSSSPLTIMNPSTISFLINYFASIGGFEAVLLCLQENE